MEVNMEIGEIARSAYNVWRGGTGAEWDALAADEQAAWLGVARRGPDRLQQFDGRPWAEPAAEVFAMISRAHLRDVGPEAFRLQPLETRVACEAVARHLVLLTDSDEADPARAEQMWLGWRAERMAKLKEAK